MAMRRNVELLRLVVDELIEGKRHERLILPAKLLKGFDEKQLNGIPVKLKVGAVSVTIGHVTNVRRGREVILGDLRFDFTEGKLICEIDPKRGITDIQGFKLEII